MEAITAHHLAKSYQEVRAVVDLDLVVEQGEIVAVLGPNGAGKTTTIEMLLGLIRPDAGQVRLFGRTPDDTSVRARVGSMLQDSDGPDNLTVAETVALVRRYYPYGLPVAEVLERADLSAKSGNKIGQLSGGQRQRLSFALAIAGDPDLLFLDEPTAALDVSARKAFWEQVRAFADLGKTILFSSHNLAETDAVAHRIVVINRGRVIVDGTPSAVKATVAAKTVRLHTDAPPEVLRQIAGVRRVDVDHTGAGHPGTSQLTIQTSEPERLLAQLFRDDQRVLDLTVLDTDLESAFVHLTSGGDADPTSNSPSNTSKEKAA